VSEQGFIIHRKRGENTQANI